MGSNPSRLSEDKSLVDKSVRNKSSNGGKQLGKGQEKLREMGASSSTKLANRHSTETSMIYERSGATSVYKGSEEYFEYSCNPCETEGDHVEAKGFCTNCKDYLCGTCLKSHSKSRTSRHHTLLDKDNMPRKSKICDPCKTAGDEKEAVDTKYQKCTEECTYIRDINVKAVKDKNCSVRGLALGIGTELIVADDKNKSLKVVNFERNVIRYSLRQMSPLGLAKISEDQVAVVLENKCEIQILSVSQNLSMVRQFSTNGDCVDIKFKCGKLYVSFCQPVKFQILQLTGEVNQTINPDSEVLKYCNIPSYIAVSPDESMIYISDSNSNKVLCMDMNGRMISMYQGILNGPRDIIISPLGSVYLCSTEQHAVYKMKSDLSDVTEILGEENGILYPQAMCFDVENQLFFISSAKRESNFGHLVKVYKMKFE